MAASTVYSTNITNILLPSISLIDGRNGKLCAIMDTIEVATTSLDEVGDMILLGPVPSTAILEDIKFLNDDLDSNVSPTLTVNVGLAYDGSQLNKNIGDEVDYDCFATSSTIFREAVTSWQSLRFEQDDIANIGKEAWDTGGLTSNPGGNLCISVRVVDVAATAAAGTISMIATYIV